MSRRAVGLAVIAIVVLTALVLVGPMAWLALDEAAVPPSSDAPPLPPGVEVAQDELLCGSGGCYRELTLTGAPDQSPAELAASVGLPHETCRARSLLDRRRVCSGVDVHGQAVVLYVRFDRSFSL